MNQELNTFIKQWSQGLFLIMDVGANPQDLRLGREVSG